MIDNDLSIKVGMETGGKKIFNFFDPEAHRRDLRAKFRSYVISLPSNPTMTISLIFCFSFKILTVD